MLPGTPPSATTSTLAWAYSPLDLTMVAGAPRQFTVTARDAFGNDLTTATGGLTWTITSNASASATGPTYTSGATYNGTVTANRTGSDLGFVIALNGAALAGSPLFANVGPAATDPTNSTASGAGLSAACSAAPPAPARTRPP